MNDLMQFISAMTAPGLLILVALIVMASGFRKGWIQQFIAALNSLNTPWVAIIVVVLGMVYNLKCKAYGLPSDSANQVIGGGLGLLTGQALKNGGKLGEPPALSSVPLDQQLSPQPSPPGEPEQH